MLEGQSMGAVEQDCSGGLLKLVVVILGDAYVEIHFRIGSLGKRI